VRLANKVILVTGFGAGLGREIALGLAREGAAVAGFSRGVEAGAETAAMIDADGGRALFIRTDVRSSADVESGVALVVAELGGIDGVVNSAGVRVIGTAMEISEAEWDLAMDTNLKGCFLVSRACVPIISGRGGGAIVNIASISGLLPARGRIAHTVSKGALLVLTEAMAADHGGESVRVNCICPGAMETPATAKPESRGGTGRAILRGKPEDAVETAVFLLSDAGKHVTGATIPLDGGARLRGGV
jgi:NAD(P)-dependent dehydrogenase (short-subunit alcohol dehydrogenase family)